jgi:GGDEF domain-containing protein
MKNKFVLGYSIFISFVFLVALSLFGINLYSEYSIGKARTQRRIDFMTSSVKKIVQENPKDFSQKMTKAIGDLNDFSTLQIKVNGKIIFSYPNGITPETSTSKLLKNFSESFKVDDSYYLFIGNLYIIRPIQIFNAAKISFLIILIATLITIILIISISNKDSKKSDEKFESNDDDLKSIDDVDLSFSIQETESIEENSTEELNISDEKFGFEEEKFELEEELPLPNQDEKPMEINVTETENPMGLFSPTTGLGWESYINTRLENELKRAISSEIDLSVFIIKLQNISRSDELFRDLCDYLSILFQFKDLLFEYKDDCILCIKLSMNVDEALAFADKIHVDLSSKIKNTGGKCSIGITSRSVRMVGAQRLLKEADEALKRAETDESSPIIAFRVDNTKYRKFIETN